MGTLLVGLHQSAITGRIRSQHGNEAALDRLHNRHVMGG
jgi:hypothetical protein